MIVLAGGVILGGRARAGREARLVGAPLVPARATSTIVRGHARNYGLDPALLAAVIYQESKFKADARVEAPARSA